MARGVASPAPTPLPKVSFVKVEDDLSTQPQGVHDQQQRSYGCEYSFLSKLNRHSRASWLYADNDFSEFKRPDHYIRYIGASGRVSLDQRFSDGFNHDDRAIGAGLGDAGRVRHG